MLFRWGAAAVGQKLPFKQLPFCAISSEVTDSLLESRSAPAPWATSASVSDRPVARKLTGYVAAQTPEGAWSSSWTNLKQWADRQSSKCMNEPRCA